MASDCSRHKAAAPAATNPAAGPPAAEVSLAYELRLGKEAYQHHCLTCHGEVGAGDGFNAFNVDPHPRDLSDPAFQKAKTDAELRTPSSGAGWVWGCPP